MKASNENIAQHGLEWFVVSMLTMDDNDITATLPAHIKLITNFQNDPKRLAIVVESGAMPITVNYKLRLTAKLSSPVMGSTDLPVAIKIDKISITTVGNAPLSLKVVDGSVNFSSMPNNVASTNEIDFSALTSGRVRAKAGDYFEGVFYEKMGETTPINPTWIRMIPRFNNDESRYALSIDKTTAVIRTNIVLKLTAKNTAPVTGSVYVPIAVTNAKILISTTSSRISITTL